MNYRVVIPNEHIYQAGYASVRRMFDICQESQEAGLERWVRKWENASMDAVVYEGETSNPNTVSMLMCLARGDDLAGLMRDLGL